MNILRVAIPRTTLLQRLRRYYVSNGMEMRRAGHKVGFVVIKDNEVFDSFKDAQTHAKLKGLLKDYEYEM